jgi:enolase
MNQNKIIMSHKITAVHADEILDSRGNPTIKATVLLDNDIIGSASVPSGASTGVHEALELRDGDDERYNGKGVLKAVHNVKTEIAEALEGMDVTKQKEIDEKMIMLDGTDNKARLGANAILGVSLACAHAAAKAKEMPLYEYLRWVYDIKAENYDLPTPTMNVLNGGAHAGWILDFQEFMVVPQQDMFKERVRCGAEIFHALATVLSDEGFSTLVGDEGGYAVSLDRNEAALEMIMRAIEKAGYEPGSEVKLAMDPAASEFYDKESDVYDLKVDGEKRSGEEMIDLFADWVEKYPITSIEDALDQDDWSGWQKMTERLGDKIALVGDDLFVTNVERLQKGIDEQVGNAILIKVNQIGSLTEAMQAIFLAQQYGYEVSVSHRSGETADTTIADLAAAVNAEYIKSGSLSRSERLAKYNRLMEIEEEVHSQA